MRLTLFFILIGLLSAYSNTRAQLLNIKSKQASLREIFIQIEQQTDLTFFYSNQDLAKVQPLSFDFQNVTLADVLVNLFRNTPLEYVRKGNTIFVSEKEATRSENKISNANGVAQQTISGQVLDFNRNPLIGATVRLIRGGEKDLYSADRQLATTTDREGKFRLTMVPGYGYVEVSFLGYTTRTLAATSELGVIVLQTAQSEIHEVLVNAGYYQVKSRESTGNISKLGSRAIEAQPVNTPLEALQGRIPGVYIVQNSGLSGGSFQVKVRGQNSLMAGTEPLYIVDGVPYDSQNARAALTSGVILPGGVGSLNSINPALIESIEVLKDADATAIYGSRGANGVVLITTKKGVSGEAQARLTSRFGMAQVSKMLDLMNTEQYLEMRREAFKNDGITNYPASAYDVNGAWDTLRYTDWQKYFIGNTAKNHQVEGSISGGSDQTQFLLGGIYQGETTIFPGDFKYARTTLNGNVRHTDRGQKMDVNFGVNYTQEDNVLPGKDMTNTAVTLPPNAPALLNEQGGFNWQNSTFNNPLAAMQQVFEQDSYKILGNGSVGYRLQDFYFKINGGVGISNHLDLQENPHTMRNPAFGTTPMTGSSIYYFENDKNNWILEGQANWKRTFGRSKIEMLLGTSWQSELSKNQSIIANGFPDNALIRNLKVASSLQYYDHDHAQYRYESFFGRINYSLQDRYYLNVTGRRDGSSRFAENNKFGNFGAIGLAWIFSEDLTLPWLSFGKLRSSYGVTGNDQIGNYQYLQTYRIDNSHRYLGNVGFVPTRLQNKDFKWEENRKFEVAMELGLFNNRLNASLAYFHHRSGNQLINYSLPVTTGFASIQQNLGAIVQNVGIELDLGVNILNRQNLTWRADLNYTLSRNKLVSFPGLVGSTYVNTYVVGQPLTIGKRSKLLGVNPETGYFQYEDVDGDGQITATGDRIYLVDRTSPKYYGGLNQSINYQNWSFDVFFQFVKRKNSSIYSNANLGSLQQNSPVGVLDRWQKPGDVSTFQRFSSGSDYQANLMRSYLSTSLLSDTDASFLRLKNASLAYRIPYGSRGSNIRLSIQGQNILTWTPYEGMDPEISYYTPALRRVVFGCEFNF